MDKLKRLFRFSFALTVAVLLTVSSSSRLCTAGGVGAGKNKSADKDDKAYKNTARSRLLEFPADVSVGLLESVDSKFYMPSKHLNGRLFSQCRGKVTVPGGVTLSLVANDVLTERAVCLKKLPADAFFGLRLKQTSFGDAQLPQISHLTGLRYLDLASTDTSDKGVESLAGLVNLGSPDIS